LWNATPRRTLGYITEAAALAEPLYRRFPEQLTFCVGNELTLFMRGIIPGRNHTQRTHAPSLREIVVSEQDTLRAFLAEVAASVRRVYGGPVSYCALPFERVDWALFDAVGVNYYRQSRQDLTDDRYLATIKRLQTAGKPVMITEFGFASCRDADNPELLGMFNATPLSMAGAYLPAIRRFIRPRVQTMHTRDEDLQSRLLIEQLQLLDRAGVDGAFVMSFSSPLALYSEDPRHDIDATSLSIVRTLPGGKRGTAYPDMGWEPKQAFHAISTCYASH
jgi:hypothetical protein